MKKAFLFVVMIVVCSFFVAAQSIDDGVLKVSLVNQEPDPAEPGKYVDVRIMLENIGNKALEDVQIEFVDNYPFYLDPSQNNLKDIGVLSAFQNDDRAYILKFKVKVEEGAVEGTNPIKIKARYGNNDWYIYEFDVDVRTIDANIALEEVLTMPSPVEPGKEAVVNMRIKNMADSVLKDISLILDLTKSTLGTADLDALPFAPTASGTEKKLWQLFPNEETVFSYKIRTYPTASSGVYKIPIQLTYYDSLGNEYVKDDIIGIVVNSEPDISAILDSTEITKSSTRGEVSFTFINKGLTDIKFLDVIVKQTDAFELLSPNEVYIGNIDSDDYERASYDIFVKQTDASQLFIPVHYEYMDSNNNKYSKDIEIRIPLYNEESAVQYGIQERQSVPLAVWLVLGAVIVFVGWRLWKRRCNAKENGK